ncbi:MAG: hypothetical protein NTX25_12225 [Proteobacteria bacterium]|nr:hypothetical protein [Pseudomonadota bacterium]
MNKFEILLCLSTILLPVQSLEAVPVFLGVPESSQRLELKPLSFAYMTAEQMAAKVRSLTGFYQPGFEDFARIIGTYDPKTGMRTNDRPSALSVLILESLMTEVAESVVAREIFLEKEDRLVFGDTDLSLIMAEEPLRILTQRICINWFSQACPMEMETLLVRSYSSYASTDGIGAWEHYLSIFLQNGLLFYL